MPTAVKYRKRGHPVRGDELVKTTIRWRYWCDICGKFLHEKDGVYRLARRGRSAGGWCLECAWAYDFLDLSPPLTHPGDPDQIEKLYHFTDSQNVPSIMQHGILSRDTLEAAGINPAMTSSRASRQMDSAAGLSRYVRLSLHPHHPMAWKALHDERCTRVTWLAIHPGVLQQADTMYSDTNALATERRVGTSPLIATRGTDQAEAMVARVPANAILEVIREITV